MKVFFGMFFFFLQLIFSAHAQRICGTTDYTQRLINTSPGIKAACDRAAAQLTATAKATLAGSARDTASNEIIYLPVVVHILYKATAGNISDDQVKSQLVVLNNDYGGTNADRINTPSVFAALAADSRIRFCLAQVDPQGRRTTGIVRKTTATDVFTTDDAVKFTAQGGDDAWDCKRYLNLWVCNLSGRTLGYSSLPGSAAAVDGVVIGYDVFGTTGNLRAPFNKGRTATHEIGHWLGLKHVWGDAICGTDDVDDTPTQQYYNYGCPSFPHVGNCSPNGNGDMFMNYMDFTDDGCMNLFTIGQKIRMRALFAQNNARNSFLVSFACDSTLAQGGPLPDTAATTVVTPPQPVAKFFSVKVYPNPAMASVTVEYTNASAAAIKTITIFNILGSKVLTAQLNKENTTLNIDKLSKGMYIVLVEDGASKVTTKIMKQ